jgi:hypothetical protein
VILPTFPLGGSHPLVAFSHQPLDLTKVLEGVGHVTVIDGKIEDVAPLGSRAREDVCKDIQAWLIHPLASTFSAIFILAIILTLEMVEILGYISNSSPSLVALSTRVVAVVMKFYARNCESSWSKELSLYGRRDLGFSFFLLV